MGILSKGLGNIKNSVSATYTLQDKELLKALGIDPEGIGSKLGEITYFICMKVLCESIGKLSLKVYKKTPEGKVPFNDSKIDLLIDEPNPYMTAYNFWSTVEFYKNHYGNCFVYVEFDKQGKPKNMWILPNGNVQIYIDDKGLFKTEDSIFYIYTDESTLKQYKLSHREVMHFKTSMSLDGVTGLCVKDILRLQIETAQYGEKYLSKFYKSGMTGGKAILQYTGNLDKVGEKMIAKRVEDYASDPLLSGKVIPLPLGFEIKTLNMSMADAQYIDINKYSALQIAAAFGIKPSHLNDYSSGKYDNVELQQLDFYVNAISPTLAMYEQETKRKLLTMKQKLNGILLKFNINAVLRGDFRSQIEALSKAINNAIYTPNEARQYLDMPTKDNGDILIVNGNYIPLERVGEQYRKGGEKNKI